MHACIYTYIYLDGWTNGWNKFSVNAKASIGRQADTTIPQRKHIPSRDKLEFWTVSGKTGLGQTNHNTADTSPYFVWFFVQILYLRNNDGNHVPRVTAVRNVSISRDLWIGRRKWAWIIKILKTYWGAQGRRLLRHFLLGRGRLGHRWCLSKCDPRVQPLNM